MGNNVYVFGKHNAIFEQLHMLQTIKCHIKIQADEIFGINMHISKKMFKTGLKRILCRATLIKTLLMLHKFKFTILPDL